MNLIPSKHYVKIIEVLPILCVDIVVQNTRGEYLLVKRVNQPKGGEWWPVGGRVLKGESLEQAAIRKVKEETSLQVNRVQPVGFFESVDDANSFGLPISYHAVSIVFTTSVDDQQQIVLDDQSLEWKYARELPAGFCVNPFHGFGLGKSNRPSSQLRSEGGEI